MRTPTAQRIPERTVLGRGLRRQRASGLGAGSDDTLLLAWIRHYAATIALFVVGAVVLATTWGVLTLPKAEVWSIVVDTQQVLPSRQLGVVAEALFRAKATYKDVLPRLGIDNPAALYKEVSLISVPESRILIIVSKGSDAYHARFAAHQMARSLAQAFNDAGYPGLIVLGSPQPASVSSAISIPVLGLIGALFGFMLGLGLSILLYQSKRPVIAMRRATEYVSPRHVVTAPGRSRWLGALRAHPPGLSTKPLEIVHAQLPHGQPVRLEAPGIGPRRRDALVRELGVVDDDGEDLPVVVVCDPKTREDDLFLGMLGRATTPADAPSILLWLE